MQKVFTVDCQAISVTKNNSGVRFVVPSEDPKKPGALLVVSTLDEDTAKSFSTGKKYEVTIKEVK